MFFRKPSGPLPRSTWLGFRYFLFKRTVRTEFLSVREYDPTFVCGASRAFEWWHSRRRILPGTPCTYGFCGYRPSEKLRALNAARHVFFNACSQERTRPAMPVKGSGIEGKCIWGTRGKSYGKKRRRGHAATSGSMGRAMISFS